MSRIITEQELKEKRYQEKFDKLEHEVDELKNIIGEYKEITNSLVQQLKEFKNLINIPIND